ncbi:hypothetical protein [Stutzerimonas xanthomarina]|uniref:hypothetical protein n=1 Tax=Stutzerimonas xanthomarina TaxID=271420 RepID=UPI0012EB6E34|nr:hypothetical protein [Stutzerimonas xanthomarina]MCP9339456.1 hypothetical protein [Stutzerimonas xanthomarina]
MARFRVSAALDIHQHHGVGQPAYRMFNVSSQIEVIVHLHGVPTVMRLHFDTALQTLQGDGARDSVRWNLFAGRQAQAHDLKLRGADDCS